MFSSHLKGGQGESAMALCRDCKSEREPELYSTENKNKALNDTEEGITMSAVPQCYVILPWTKTQNVAQALCVCMREGLGLLSEHMEHVLYISFH